MKNLRKIVSVIAMSLAFSFAGQVVSQESISDPELKKVIEMIKLEMAQHTGMQAYYDEEAQVVSLSGFSHDPSYVANLVSKLESFEHVKEVINTITISKD